MVMPMEKIQSKVAWSNMKLLLHTCCGPCFLGVWEELGLHKDIQTTLYYYNPNIYPEAEWAKRRDNLLIASKEEKMTLVEAAYEPENYEQAIAGLDSSLRGNDGKAGRNNGGLRCLRCYRLRLEGTAKYAKSNGFDAISTTLFVSPYQQHDELKKVASEVASHYGVECYYTDWRPYFREGQNEAKELEIYRQKYCGCEFSQRCNEK